MKRVLSTLLIVWFSIIGGLFFSVSSLAQGNQESSSMVIARVKYQGGGDWYNDPSAVPNLCAFVRINTHADIALEEAQVSLTDEKLFSYPFLFLTGHGQLSLSDEESRQLRTYLLHGGFLYVDDDYGLDESFRKAMKKVFPSRELVELPFSHGIYSIHYRFENGLPKIHEHDNKLPQGFGLFDDHGRLMVFYTYETNISDGWVDPDVYEDPPEKRDAALKMGTNILIWSLLN